MIKLVIVTFMLFMLTRFTKQLKSIDSIPQEFTKARLFLRIIVSCAIVLLILSTILIATIPQS